MTNIIDGMDQARFTSPNGVVKEKNKKEVTKEEKKTPMVLRNLKNGS